MRIGVIASPWLPVPPLAYGGTELVLDNLCRGLAGLGHDVLLCTTGDSTCPVERQWSIETSVGVDLASPVTEVRHVMDAYDAARDWGVDIVHDHTVTGPIWATLQSGPPVVTTNHGPFEGDLLAIYQRLADRIPIIAISHHQAASARGVPITAVIHHGLDTAAVEPGEGRGDYALFLGRMSPTKGVHLAVHVARAAGMPLRIAAKMREQLEHEYFNDQVRPLLGGDIEYVGEVGGGPKQQLLGEARCLLNPILWAEPFGMVMAEALASGTPVVATPYGAAPEIVDEGVTGFLRTDAASLVTALSKVDELDRAACREAAVSRFSMERMAAEHVAFFEQQLGLPAQPRGDLVS